MKYQEFRTLVRKYPVISRSLLGMLDENDRIQRNQLSRWHKQGMIMQLKRGLYLLPPDDRAVKPSSYFLANQLVFPSYVSLEAALSYYHLIPETVYQVTSVTTKKPGYFSTEEGNFVYRHVKPDLYFGFHTLTDNAGLSFFIATAEKALADFFYLNLAQFLPSDKNIFRESYRLNVNENIDPDRLIDISTKFSSKKLKQVVGNFVDAFYGKTVNA